MRFSKTYIKIYSKYLWVLYLSKSKIKLQNGSTILFFKKLFSPAVKGLLNKNKIVLIYLGSCNNLPQT